MTATLDYSFLDANGASSIFFPRIDHSAPPDGATDIEIEMRDKVRLNARFYIYADDAPTILYFHGNGEVAPDHDDIAPLYERIGVNLFVAEFRGYGASGGEPTFSHLVADALPTAEQFHAYLDERGFSAARYLMGRSLGSHPALELAANGAEGFLGLIIESGAANLRRLLTRLGVEGSNEGEALAAAHDAKLRTIGLPTLIIHGANDDLVPASQASILNELLGAAVTELLLIPGAGHNDLLWVDAGAYFAAIRRLISA